MIKKDIFFSFFTLFIFIFLLYFFSFLYFKKFVGFQNLELIKYNDQLIFIEKYTKRLHHLRHYLDKHLDIDKPETILFSQSEFNNNNNENEVLFLGDSWFEQLASYNLSSRGIKNYFKKKRTNYFNAGITSYSPSVMLIQYQILKQDFNLKPKIVVVYIDQTDFGDEICRYKNNKIFKNNKLYAIKDFFIMPRIINFSKINNKYDNLFLKELYFFNYYLREKFFLALNKFKKFFNKNKNLYGCDINKILSYLIEPTKKDLNYFNNSISELLNFIKTDNFVEKILIVTFPHRNHMNNITNLKNLEDFNIDVANIVNNYLSENQSDIIYHLNFSDLIKKEKVVLDDNDFIPNDFGSHLIEDAHHSIFVSEIIKKIDSFIND